MSAAPIEVHQSDGSPTPLSTPSRMRADVQALRALAVVLVVVFHLFPGRLTGGFVGVDVFFVISGYLITAHLLREVHERKHVRLATFWARRARRLLPASLTVLLATLAATVLWAPQTLWQDFAREVGASALYVQNWVLATDAVDYLAAENTASPVQHFWTLSAEEQFYFVWPLLIGLVAWWAVRSHRIPTPRTFAVPLAAVVVASLTYSIWFTASNPAAAYFITPTRAWEFGAGGLLACMPALVTHHRVRISMFLGGVAMIIATGLLYTGSTPFPSYTAALPVIGTLLVLAARANMKDTFLAPLATKPVQWVGDASYSIYLWHWPLIVLWPHIVNSDVGRLDKVAILVATIVLAALSYHLIENPARRARFLTQRPPRVTFLASLAAMMIVLIAAVAMWQYIERLRTEGEMEPPPWTMTVDAEGNVKTLDGAETASEEECLGAQVMAPGSADCLPPQDADALYPSVLAVAEDRSDICRAGYTDPDPAVCTAGVPRDKADEVVALVGDSHAEHWYPAMEQVALYNRWHLIIIVKDSCPLTTATRSHPRSDVSESCAEWNQAVTKILSDDAEISRIFVSSSARNGFETPYKSDSRGNRAAAEGYADAWTQLPAGLEHLYVIRGTPYPRADTIECIEKLAVADRPKAEACALTREEAVFDDPALVAAKSSDRNVSVIDMTDYFCTGQLCPVAIGNVIVYRDNSHLTETYALSLSPYLQVKSREVV